MPMMERGSSRPNRDSPVDLGHTVEHGMVTYEGLPGPIVCDCMSRLESRSRYAEGTEFQIGRIDLVANTGTYVDSPFHRFAVGSDLAELPLSSLADREGVLVDVTGGGRAIGEDRLAGLEVEGRAVLVHTGWAEHWGTERYLRGHPHLTRGAAEHLAGEGAALVGVDSYDIDDTEDLERPVHTILLGREIPIVEHMRGLEQLAGRPFRFSAVPVKVQGFGTFPVRAFAVTGAAS